MLYALIACNSIEEVNIISETGKTAIVSFNIDGEVTAMFENMSRAETEKIYEICIDEKTSETSVTPYLHGTFTSLDNVNAELLVGKTYLVSCQVTMGETASATGAFAQVSNSTAVSYDSNKRFTHYSCDSYQLKDVYYGETTVEIASAVGTTISIDALYCDFGIKFNVTKPLSGTLTVSSTDPAFSYSFSADGATTFPTEALRYTMKHPWAENEAITIIATYSKDNITKEVTITPKRNKAAKLNINLNPATATSVIEYILDEVDLSEEKEIDIFSDPSYYTSNTIDGKKFVDLGLPSRTLWATFNVGTIQPAHYGYYYAWGDITTRAGAGTGGYSWSTYLIGFGGSFANSNDCGTDKDPMKDYVYPNNNNIAESQYDVAQKIWKGSWKIPTAEQQEELCKNCYWEWTNGYNNSKIIGFIVYRVKAIEDKGKYSFLSPQLVATYSLSDTHIFLPASGWYEGSSLKNNGSYGFYWSSDSFDNPEESYIMEFNSNQISHHSNKIRCYGGSIRPVVENQ